MKPIQEPNQGSKNSYLGWTDRQLERRPIPMAATPAASGLTRGAPIHTEIVTVNNALPQSATLFTQYPFDLTYGGTTPVGTAVGNGTPLPPTQYFDFDAENCCIGLPMGGTVYYEAHFQGANVPDIGTSWDMAIVSSRHGDCPGYDPDAHSSFFGVAPENVSIYDGAAMVASDSVFTRALFSTDDDSEREWLQFAYMHNGPTVEDVNFSRITLEISFWPAGFDWNNGAFFGTQGKGVLVVTPAVPTTISVGDPVTVTFAGEENPTTTDWIACFPLGGDTGDFEVGNWVYTNSGTQTAGGTPAASGTWTMDTSGLSAGDYQFRWLYNDTLGVLVEGDSFIRIV